jgi:hypothetical protein
MWTQKIDYVDVEVVLPPPVKKQVWDPDTQSFVPMTLYRRQGIPNNKELDWLHETYGQPGVYKQGLFWDYTNAGNFIVMDEKVYTWYSMKWGNK